MAFRDYAAGPEPGVTDVHAYGAECYKCALTFYVWEVEGSCVTGACGLVKCAPPIGDAELFSTSRPENLTTVICAVAQAASGKVHPVASIQLRSTAMSGTRYQAFCCPRCGAVYGDFFLRDLIMNAGYDGPDLEIRIPAAVRGIPQPHWCVDVGEGHCLVPPG